MIFTISLLVVAASLGAVWFVQRLYLLSHWKRRGIPGPEPSIFFGNIWQCYKKGFIAAMSEWKSRYGPVFGIYNGFAPLFVVADADIIKQIQQQHFASFMDRGAPMGEQPLPNAILNQSGERWKICRGKITPAFTSHKLRMISSTVEKIVDELVERLEQFADSGEEADIYGAYKQLTADVITRVAMGVNYGIQKQNGGRVLARMQQFFELRLNPAIIMIMSFPVLRHFSMLFQTLINSLMNREDRFQDPGALLMNDCREAVRLRKSDPSASRKDLLQLLIEAQGHETDVEELEVNDRDKKISSEQPSRVGHHRVDEHPIMGLTEDEVIENAYLVMVAGFETTANSLATLTHHIANNPDIQTRLREELSALDEKADDLYAQLEKLKYLDAVIKECLRLYSPVFMITRECLEDITINGVEFQRRDIIGISISELHMDDRYWHEPSTFCPQRFLEDSVHPGAYQPFGGGPRNCIGMRFALMEIKLVIAKLVRRFHLSRGPSTPRHLQLVPYAAVQKPDHPITCTLSWVA